MNNRILVIAASVLMLVSCGTTPQYIRQAISSSSKVSDIILDEELFRFVEIETGVSENARDLQTVFFIGGSGCTSLRTYLAPYFNSFPKGYRVIGLEKSGAENNSFGRSCSNKFWRAYRYEEMLRRNLKAINKIEAETGQPITAIVGVSEGGPQALEIAAAKPTIGKVVVIAAGGMSQRQELNILAEKSGSQNELNATLDRIDASPNDHTAWAMGYPHTYWAAILDRDPDDYLALVNQPTLILIGENDRNVPVESAQHAVKELQKGQLIVWPGADHTFQTSKGNERRLVIKKAGDFLKKPTS